jgi:hypothetical protein
MQSQKPAHAALDRSSIAKISLLDVWVHFQGFLDSSARAAMLLLTPSFSYGVLCSPLWVCRPWPPFGCRHWGFGSVSRDRSAATAAPTFLHVFHHIWPFLSPYHRHRAQQLLGPETLQCSYLCAMAAVTSVASLRAPRPPPTKVLTVNEARTRLFGCALLRFEFIYCDVIRWLSGEHTNRSHNWTTTFQHLQAPTPHGCPRQAPPTDFPRAQRTEGVPPVGAFESHPPEVRARVD